MYRDQYKIKGRVLHIGNSYYNNWYLANALRPLGWQVDVLTYKGEGSDINSFGYDFSLHIYDQLDREYPKFRFEFLEDVLRSFIQEADHRNISLNPWREFTEKMMTSFLRLLPTRIFVLLIDRLIEKYLTGLKLPSKSKIYEALDVAMLARVLSLPTRILVILIDHLDREDWGSLKSPVKTKIIQALDLAPDTRLLKKLLQILIDSTRATRLAELQPLFDVLDHYDILHFTGVQNIRFLYFFNPALFGSMPIGWDVALLKKLGKKIVYSNTGCLDGISQSAFRAWPGSEPVCDICVWRDRPEVCSDERNLAWGKLRNQLSDYQCTLGGNRADYNDDPRVHEVPEFYCLDTEFWRPDLPIPEKYQLEIPEDTVKIYHAVGNFYLRSQGKENRNVKSTHIYLPLIEQLKTEGYKVDLIFCHDVPGTEVRFYQAQADIVVDMLTFGFFGANVREAMMLGKPVVCFLRPVWLESMRREIPEYVDELPVISATPATIHEVLVDLITHPQKRREIGMKSREFAVKWHSKEAGARRFDRIYADLLSKGKTHAARN